MGSRKGVEDEEDGREMRREGARQGWRMLCPGLTSLGRWEFLASSSVCWFLAAGGVITERLERRRLGRGQQLLQPPLAEVRCLLLRPPARVSASLGAGSEAAPPSPRPPRVQP